MARFFRAERIEIVDGQLCRIISAAKKKRFFDIAKIYEDGTQLCRNIYWAGCGGWVYEEPGSRRHGYAHTQIIEKEDWGKAWYNVDNIYYEPPTPASVDKILSKYPEFKWVLNKVDWNTTTIFKVLKLWKKEPKLTETLVSMGRTDYAQNGSLYKAKDRWNIVKWLSRNHDANISLQDLRIMRKYDATLEEVKDYRRNVWRYNYINFTQWRYTKKVNIEPQFYKDYLSLCQEVKKDLDDPYWAFPANFNERHDKVLEEVMNHRAAAEAIRQAKMAKEQQERIKKEKSKFDMFHKMMAKLTERRFSEGNLDVFIPQSVETVMKQADTLNQCLIDCDYIKKVVEKKCLLVFILKDGLPYATAELIKKGRKFRIGQFYGDQNLDDYNATEEARNALDSWAKTFKVNIAA